ncbi:hypothetical protein C7S16_6274 [Burkholderia thailandensis]|uniref:Uncharacterized protein n=2 Tax=Burkholderia thailandensis TaxID=57975 RepID=A0AAW9CMT4_BURTH|nr:hypothetical protein [Burkholderia thailandensis]
MCGTFAIAPRHACGTWLHIDSTCYRPPARRSNRCPVDRGGAALRIRSVDCGGGARRTHAANVRPANVMARVSRRAVRTWRMCGDPHRRKRLRSRISRRCERN